MLTTPAIAVQFDYTALAAGDAAAVRRATDRLRSALTSTARLVVRIGLQLARVRRRLKPYRGGWDAYIRAEVPWSRAQVYRLIRAALVFRRVADVDRFQPTALYVLTWPNAPAGATRAALALARNGERIDAATARQLVAEHRPVPPGSTGGESHPTDTPAEESAPEGPEPTPDGSDAECGRLMGQAMARFSTLHVMQPEDDERVGVTGYPKDEGEPITTGWGGTLILSLKKLLGVVETKKCGTCGEAKPVGQFCRDANADDGLNRYCRDCAREFREAQKRKKGPRTRRPRMRPVV